jgi:hypothetical protein
LRTAELYIFADCFIKEAGVCGDIVLWSSIATLYFLKNDPRIKFNTTDFK